MRRSILRSTLLATAATLLLASGAAAGGPTRDPAPTPDDFLAPGGSDFCSFDVLIHVSVNQEYELTWIYPDGSVQIRITGEFVAVFTNLDTDTSISSNISGPAVITLDAAGNLISYVATGPGGAFGQLGTIQSSGIFVYYGRLDLVNNTFTGHRVDICAALS
jgi:hypothetical protein